MTSTRVFLDKSDNIYGMTEISKIEKPPHNHYMKHIVVSLDGNIKCTISNQCIDCSGFAIQSEVCHSINSQKPILLISIPEVSNIGKSMNKYIFQDNEYYIFSESIVEKIRNYWSSNFMRDNLVKNLFNLLNIPINEIFIKDTRVLKIMEILASSEEFEYSLKKLAILVNLSEGRLSRLFHAETGVTLKNYILLLKLSKTFSYMLMGKNLTTSCIEAGFSSSAHFAYALRKWFGFSGRELMCYLKKTDFL